MLIQKADTVHRLLVKLQITPKLDAELNNGIRCSNLFLAAGISEGNNVCQFVYGHCTIFPGCDVNSE